MNTALGRAELHPKPERQLRASFVLQDFPLELI